MSYPGGKAAEGVAQHIINQIPPHEVYIEAFLGAGAIIKTKKPAAYNLGIEINPAVIAKYHNGARYKVINDDAISQLEKFMLFKDAFDMKQVFIYLDPPYPFDVRTKKNIYGPYEMDNDCHKLLLNFIKTIPAMVAISTYPNQLYSSMLDTWRHIDFQAQTRGGVRTERLYMNYAVPTALHEYTYLGNNFKERQAIRRKIERNVAKFKAMPVLERKAILESIDTVRNS